MHLAESAGEGGKFFREEQRTLVQITDVAGEVLDFGEIVRGEKDGAVADAVEQALISSSRTSGSRPEKGSSRMSRLGR